MSERQHRLRRLRAERSQYREAAERVLAIAGKHKEAGTCIEPGEVFAAFYISDRPMTAADIQRGQEIQAELDKETP